MSVMRNIFEVVARAALYPGWKIRLLKPAVREFGARRVLAWHVRQRRKKREAKAEAAFVRREAIRLMGEDGPEDGSFDRAWLEGDGFRRHLDRRLAGCSPGFASRMKLEEKERYADASQERRKSWFERGCGDIARDLWRKAHPVSRADVKHNMVEMLYRWEHGLHLCEYYYSGGPDGLRRDLEDGRFD